MLAVAESTLLLPATVTEADAAGEVPAAHTRPDRLKGVTYRSPSPLGTVYCSVNSDGAGIPFEVFLNVGKAGSDTAAVAEAIGRLISLILRLPSPVPRATRLAQVARQLRGIGGGRPMGFGPARIESLPDAVGKVLEEHLGLEGNGHDEDVLAGDAPQ